MKILNWKLALLSFLFFCLFIGLGLWQLSRYHQKKILLHAFETRTTQSPLSTATLDQTHLRFHRLKLDGYFDNKHTFLLDNKIVQGKVGYEIYTPFRAKNLQFAILIDRGFVPMNPDRSILPAIHPIEGQVSVTGMINTPPKYFAFGGLYETLQWPLRVEFIDLQTLKTLLPYSLAPYVLCLEPANSAAYAIEWQIFSISPERHLAYTVQWFALAITLLILFVALNRA